MEALAVSNPFPGAAAFVVAETESTMAEARGLARLGFPPGSLVAAEFQSAGRGRFPDRRWISEPGESLLFTIRLDPDTAQLAALPLRVGAVLARAVVLYAIRYDRALHARVLVKWPNDLMLGDRKAAGVLCERSAGGPEAGVYVGVGVNCNQRSFPDSLPFRATSLAMELGETIERWVLLELFLDLLHQELHEPAWKNGVEERLWRRGELVRFRPGAAFGDTVEALLEGIDDTGSLLLAASGWSGPRPFVSGELLV